MASETFVCPVCGKTVTRRIRWKQHKNKYCSEECCKIFRRRNAKAPRKTDTKHDRRSCERVKIVITTVPALLAAYEPKLGGVYEAEKYQYGNVPGYVISVGGNRVCIRVNECKEIVEGGYAES